MKWWIVVLVAVVAATGAGVANADYHRPARARLRAAGWFQIALGPNRQTLLIDQPQSTADTHSPCFVHYRVGRVRETARVIRIELLAPPPPTWLACAALAVRGPFLVPVHLPHPYHGQQLVDASTGIEHPLTPRSQLS